jgi:4-oxalocrotonate tautomerase
MPLIQITLLGGRTTAQKRRIAERITDVMVEEANAPRDGVIVAFVDVPTDSYARGGVLMKDRIEQQQNTVKT